MLWVAADCFTTNKNNNIFSPREKRKRKKRRKKGGSKRNETEHCKKRDSPISPSDPQASTTISGDCPLLNNK